MSIIQGTSKSSAAAAYEIDQSIRFNDDDSAHMNRIFGAGGTPKTFTTGCWFKVASFGDVRGIINSEDNSGSALDDFIIRLSAADKLEVIYKNTSNTQKIYWTSDFVLRDPAAWYFVAVTCDTTPATPIFKVFCNASGTSDWDCDSVMTKTTDSLAQNDESSFLRNSNEAHIGAFYNAGAGSYFDGYMAEIFIQDGVVITDPFTDGYVEIDENGVYRPLDLSGKTFGTQGGLYLGSNSADLGEESTGNGNDFTSSGLTAADQVTDSPTDNYGVMNPLDNGRPSNITLSDGNLTAAFAGSGYSGGIRSSIFFDSEDSDGWYAECTLDSLAIASVFRAGVANASLNLASSDAQTSADGWAYSDQGAKLNNSYTTGYGSSVGVGDVVGIAVRNGKIYFAVNNTWQGSADPVTESNPAFSNLTGDVAFCQSTNTGGSYAHTATWNFGQTGFTYTPPTGYKSLRVQDLSDPTIADPSAYFQPTLYTGNGVGSGSGGQEINQVGNSTFQPDFVWIKVRNLGTETHCLQDVVRGANKRLQSNSTAAENTETEGLLSFDSDGFTVGSRDPFNKNTATYVAWQWLADNTSGSSDTNGSITSTVSANTTSGFSIVSYTGTGANATVGHGLGVAPQMIIIKNRPDVDNWIVYHEAMGATKGLNLNSTATPTTAITYFNNTAPTSSVFSIGSGGGTNGSGDAQIAYCFANVDGFSKFGSYTGNGSTDGPFVFTGFKPKWIMYKRISGGTGNWDILDAERDPINVADAVLAADKTTAETTYATIKIDMLSNGYKIRGTQTNLNASGSTYIYMAFGDSFKTATAR